MVHAAAPAGSVGQQLLAGQLLALRPFAEGSTRRIDAMDFALAIPQFRPTMGTRAKTVEHLSMGTTFFLRGKDCSRGYSNFRGMRQWTQMRQYANSLWAIYEPYADTHFRQDGRNHLLERYWEMYLTVALMANGAKPVRMSASGPEFYFPFRGGSGNRPERRGR